MPSSAAYRSWYGTRRWRELARLVVASGGGVCATPGCPNLATQLDGRNGRESRSPPASPVTLEQQVVERNIAWAEGYNRCQQEVAARERPSPRPAIY